MRSMNSVAKARARSVRGSTVESVRVPNDIVNMLLQSDVHRIYQISDVLPPRMKHEYEVTYFRAYRPTKWAGLIGTVPILVS